MTKNMRRLAAVGLLLGLVAVWWTSNRSSPDHDRVRAAAGEEAARESQPTTNRADASDTKAGTVTPVSAVRPQLSTSTMIGAPIQLRVRVPSEVKVGETFEAQVQVQTAAAVSKILFSVAYDNRRLLLVSSSVGNLAQQGSRDIEFGAEEPSDGNIQVSLDAHNGRSLSGAGDLAVFQFQAIKSGTFPIVLQNVNTFDASGVSAADGAVVQEVLLTIR
ncbi:MAG: cohesin domain-containing protein [Vicinamibacterales bacterium]